MGQNCPKAPPVSHYQGTMTCESMVGRQRREGKSSKDDLFMQEEMPA
jgi:hypothetical protein